MRLRSGLTLVELSVVAILIVVVLMTCLSIQQRIERQRQRIQLHLAGLSAVQILSQSLRLDIAGEVHLVSAAPTPTGTPDDAVRCTVSSDGRSMILHRSAQKLQKVPPVDAATGRIDPLPIIDVKYTFDPSTHQVSRQVGQEAPRPIRAARYLDVKFARPSAPTSSGPIAALLTDQHLLLVTLRWVPEEVVDRPAMHTTILETTLSFGLEREALFAANPHRIANLTSFAVLVPSDR